MMVFFVCDIEVVDAGSAPKNSTQNAPEVSKTQVFEIGIVRTG
jgi:hypothetical protein